MKQIFFILSIFGCVNFSISQSNSPRIAWLYHDIPDDLPDGATISPVPGSGVVPGTEQGFDNSGEDWWYDVENIYESGQHTGYITCGFATW
jgi:hypothetical protein